MGWINNSKIGLKKTAKESWKLHLVPDAYYLVFDADLIILCSLDPFNSRVNISKMSDKKATTTSATKKAGAAASQKATPPKVEVRD